MKNLLLLQMYEIFLNENDHLLPLYPFFLAFNN